MRIRCYHFINAGFNIDTFPKLLKHHSSKLASRLKEEISKIPDFIIEQAQKDLKLVFLSKRRYFVVDQPEIIENTDDIQEEWYTTTYEILENIYFENSRFWDKEILQHDTEFIDYMLELFITCQNLKTTKELNEFRR